MSDRLKLEDLQSFDDINFSVKPLEKQPDNRRSERKQFEVDGTLMLEGTSHAIRTLDLSANGVSIEIKKQIGVGLECQVSFEAANAGGPILIAGGARVVYCFHIGAQNYRAGLEFLDLTAGREQLATLLGV